jgi:hypothetical protein
MKLIILLISCAVLGLFALAGASDWDVPDSSAILARARAQAPAMVSPKSAPAAQKNSPKRKDEPRRVKACYYDMNCTGKLVEGHEYASYKECSAFHGRTWWGPYFKGEAPQCIGIKW